MVADNDSDDFAGEEEAFIRDGEPTRRRRPVGTLGVSQRGPDEEELFHPSEDLSSETDNFPSLVGSVQVQKSVMESPSEDSQERGFFKVWLLLSQLLGFICIALVSAWVGQYLGGFAWHSAPKLQFNLHPFLMVIGMLFCYGDAILVYRVFRNQRKRPLKLLHFGLHSCAFICTVVALKAVFDFHNLSSPPIPNLYTIHSWIGLTAVILFTLQYVCGFIAFLYPRLTKIWRAKYLPLHVFFGVGIFLMAVAAALTGINEKLIFLGVKDYSAGNATGVIGNLLGYCLTLFAFLVVYMVVTPSFQRRPLPEEVQLQLEQHSPTN